MRLRSAAAGLAWAAAACSLVLCIAALVLLAQASAVAAAERVSLKTVRNHVSTIFSKLQVADRAQAVVRAREAGLG